MNMNPYNFPQFCFYSLILSAFLMISACTSSPELPNDFDVAGWKKDLHGCLGLREKQVNTLLKMRDEFTGITESQVVSLLGRPDHSELGKSKIQKYGYRLTPGKGCESPSSSTFGKVLQIEFESLGRVRLMTVQVIKN